MKTALLLGAAAAAVAFFPASMADAAQPTPDSLLQFAQCATTNYEGAELLATQPGSAEETEVLAEYGRRSCAIPAVDPGVLRGAVAEQLFKTDFGSIGARPRRETIEIFTINLQELEALGDNAKKRIDYVAFGTCVAVANPEGSSKLLTTKVESAEEKAVMTELVPQFASCLAAGERFTFSRADLRSALAEGAYRLALSRSVNGEIVVTGARDPSQSVTCKRRSVASTGIRRTVCLTEAQWSSRAREDEYDAEDAKRISREYEEIQTTIITRSRFAAGG
jgi:hypothetical protein